MSLLRQGKAQVLTIYLGESDQWQGTPLYVTILQYLREQGCAGATVTRAVAGYGGAYTTFSRLALRDILLFGGNRWLPAMLYLILNIFGGVPIENKLAG